MRKNILYAHAGSGNHGCEAIVRSSVELIGDCITLYSTNPIQDEKYGLGELVDKILPENDEIIKKYSAAWFSAKIQTKITGAITNEIYNGKRSMFRNVKRGDIAFSIGGDNYCYPGTEILREENYLFKRKGAKTILWGCSVEPESLENSDVAKDIASYDLIFARESISYEALKRVNKNTWLIPDSAFTLKYRECELPSGWIQDGMIGINVSPLILENSKNGQVVLDAYKELISYILNNTNYSIALIPHVVWETNDDRIPLKVLFDMFCDTNRIVLLNDCNCMELKGYIRRCKMFVGARTHATIAAYSSCVPTLVLGYSVKSRGIARDLFGNEEKYVMPVQAIHSKDELVENFVWIMECENEIRQHLKCVIPEYVSRVYQSKEILNKLL